MRNDPVTRRRLGALGAGAAAAGISACAPRGAGAPALQSRQFPPDFAWGAASAAYQTEGSTGADGRGPSIWDVFAATPGKIVDGSDASLACDSYRRYTEDADLIAAANLRHYRFSVAWPRVQPDGVAANGAGLDHYARVADALLERGVAPHLTLFHWDLPQALQDKGGWRARDTSLRFADYAAGVAERLGDRVKSFIVLNEAAVHTVLGHVLGEHAPGLKDAGLLGPVIHHLNLAQGLAIKAMRAGRSDLRIGTTLALQPARPEGAPLAFWNRPAADGFDALWNGAFLDPLFEGRYPEAAAALVEPFVEAGDIDIVRQPVDFAGVNYYSPTTIRLDLSSPSRIAPGEPPAAAPRDAFGREIDPSGLFEMLERLRTRYGDPLIYITENGCSDPFSDGPAILDDGFRIDYLRAHLEAVKAAMEAGCRVAGYFHWTLIDNWEWALGYRSKFGLVAMDRRTGAREPKASYRWFARLAATGLLDEAGPA